jgi:hypothetical protein
VSHSLQDTFDKADREIVAAVQKLHIGAQVARFLRITLFAFIGALPALATGDLSWATLAPVITGALETEFRQLYPSLPLGGATGVVTSAIKTQATNVATAAVDNLIADAKARADQVAAALGLVKDATNAGVPVDSLEARLVPPEAVPPVEPVTAAPATPAA